MSPWVPASGKRVKRLTNTWRRVLRLARGGSAGRSALGRRWLFDLASRFTPTLEAEWPSGRYLVPTQGGWIGRNTFSAGPYELDEGRLAIDALGRLAATPFDLSDKVVVEVGANIGTVTVPLVTVHDAGRVIAIEPAPANFRYLAANVALNSLSGRVHPVNVAASDADGTIELEVAEHQWGDYRVRPVNYSPRDDFAESTRPTVTVSTSRIDTLLGELGIDPGRVGLLWIDVQGHEAHVLAGAAALLRQRTPVVLEYWPYGLHAVGSLEMLENLISSHYRYFLDISEIAPGDGRSGPDADLPVRQTSTIADLRVAYPQDDDGTFAHRFTNLILWG